MDWRRSSFEHSARGQVPCGRSRPLALPAPAVPLLGARRVVRIVAAPLARELIQQLELKTAQEVLLRLDRGVGSARIQLPRWPAFLHIPSRPWFVLVVAV